LRLPCALKIGAESEAAPGGEFGIIAVLSNARPAGSAAEPEAGISTKPQQSVSFVFYSTLEIHHG
jgi:hypothetical protein